MAASAPLHFLPSLIYLFFHSSYSLLAHPTPGLLEYKLHVSRAFCCVYPAPELVPGTE